MSTRLSNEHTSVVLRSYACARLHEDDAQPTLVFLEIAPHHPQQVKAIWASLVDGARQTLWLNDDDRERRFAVRGLSRRYQRLVIDVPQLAGRARPKFMRLIAPEAIAIQHLAQPFVCLAWTQPDGSIMSPATTLAAMLEAGTHLPMQIGWGSYLLAEAETRGFAIPLERGGKSPEGYLVKDAAPWDEIIASGIKTEQITLDGACHACRLSMPVEMPIPEQVMQVA